MSGGAAAVPVPGTTRGKRIPTLDLIRGFFMVSIMMNHTLGANVGEGYSRYFTWALSTLLTGTIGFTTVSGMLVGYFFVTKANDLPRIFGRYRQQALRLLFIAHPLMALALFAPSGVSFPSQLAGAWYITDTLAALFLFVVPYMHRLAPRTRLAIGIALVAVGRVLLVIPAHSWGFLLLRDILAGVNPNTEHVLHSDYALLPLSGVFFVGSFIGHHYALAERDGTLADFTRRGWRACAWMVAGCACLLVPYLLAKLVMKDAATLRLFFYPDYFFSLYPYYVAVTLAIMLLFISRQKIGPVEDFLIIFGKTALFTYVVHYYLVQTLPYLLGVSGTLSLWEAAAFGAAAILFLNWAARLYNTHYKKV